MGGGYNKNYKHSLHVVAHPGLTGPKKEAIRCVDSGRGLHGSFCSNSTLDNGCTKLHSWERVLANEYIVPE